MSGRALFPTAKATYHRSSNSAQTQRMFCRPMFPNGWHLLHGTGRGFTANITRTTKSQTITSNKSHYMASSTIMIETTYLW
jgi:hypothetical protein